MNMRDMKKLLLPVFGLALLATSCTTAYKSATVRDVKAPIVSAVTADLEVSNKKIVYMYEPTGKVRRGGYQNCVNAAVNEALLLNGRADVLVETQTAVVERLGLFGGRKIKSVTVTGYPAVYKNFKSVDAQTLKESIQNNGLPGTMKLIPTRSGFKGAQ